LDKASDRDSSTGSPKPRNLNRAGSICSDSDDNELFAKAKDLSLTEKWNVGVKEFVPGNFNMPPKVPFDTMALERFFRPMSVG
jgi:hypothetical protein